MRTRIASWIRDGRPEPESVELTMLKLIKTSDKVTRLSEAGYAYNTELRKFEHQFESKAAALLEVYLAAVLEIHETPEPWTPLWFP